MNLANKVEYIATDEQRQVIPWVRFTDSSGKVTEYRTKDFTNNIAGHQIRRMDCLDCHNRPAHDFHAPNDAVDIAMGTGKIDPSIPWIKSNVVAALVAPYATEDEALGKIAASLRTAYPKESRVENVITAAQTIFKRNFFPEMKADWRAYPNNIGHKEWAGCFRCHDGLHKKRGRSQHLRKRLQLLSHHSRPGQRRRVVQAKRQGPLPFFHIDAVNEDFSCKQLSYGRFPERIKKIVMP